MVKRHGRNDWQTWSVEQFLTKLKQVLALRILDHGVRSVLSLTTGAAIQTPSSAPKSQLDLCTFIDLISIDLRRRVSNTLVFVKLKIQRGPEAI